MSCQWQPSCKYGTSTKWGRQKRLILAVAGSCYYRTAQEVSAIQSQADREFFPLRINRSRIEIAKRLRLHDVKLTLHMPLKDNMVFACMVIVAL